MGRRLTGRGGRVSERGSAEAEKQPQRPVLEFTMPRKKKCSQLPHGGG
uniref:Uncharacterized protein n=1 Tax=Peronospora matthiolae TaxID=2874970 RepID=A0AAV1VI85_9STRA